MLKSLRVKFVALNMVTVALVLTVAFGAICLLDWQQAVNGVYDAMRLSVNKAVESKGESSEPASEASQPGGESSRFSIGSYDDKRGFIPVAVFVCGESGLEAVESATNADLSEDAVDQAASEVSAASDGRGDIPELGLFYLKKTVGGVEYVAFADHASAGSWQTLVPVLGIVGAFALVAFFVLAILFARWALRPVESAWKAQRQFVADASHELKTPLTVVLANSAILMEHPDRSVASQTKWIESIQREAEVMQSLVEDLLDLARLDEKTSLKHEPVELSDIVELELLQFESVAFERDIEFLSEIEPEIWAIGDGDRLARVVATLLENACKYAGEGGRVEVRASSVGRKAVFSVSNTGAPIPPEDLPRVFDRFYRADKARTRGVGGFGLGLAIAREAVEGMGGSIKAQSDDERTMFAIELPLA